MVPGTVLKIMPYRLCPAFYHMWTGPLLLNIHQGGCASHAVGTLVANPHEAVAQILWRIAYPQMSKLAKVWGSLLWLRNGQPFDNATHNLYRT